MRKRLRKKLRLREFIEFAFTARYQVKPGLSPAALDSLLDRFILEAIEANDLHCGGGGGPAEWEFIACANGRRSASEADRQQVRIWLEGQANISLVFVGQLQDAWHGDDDAFEKPHVELNNAMNLTKSTRTALGLRRLLQGGSADNSGTGRQA